MTALVSVLNKRAAVLAADSAVTVTKNGKAKIYNTATKIFQLSSSRPVGVMIFSSSSFMGTPWDVIFNLYRERLGTKSFETLREYAMNFIKFLNSEKCFNESECQKNYFLEELSTYYYRVKDNAVNDIKQEYETLGEECVDTNALFLEHLRNSLKIASELFEKSGVSPDFENYSINKMRAYAQNEFDTLMDICREEGIPELRDEWEQGFFDYIRSKIYYNFTGIVFVGYGDGEIYPSLMPAYICGSFDGRLRYYFDEENSSMISNENNAEIRPFAQTDIMLALMKGVHPNLYEKVVEGQEESVAAIRRKIVQELQDNNAPEQLVTKVADMDFDDICDDFQAGIMKCIENDFVDGIVDAVASFNIEDMINMSESLVSITNLHRHISSSEESVGGPIDVAVITRSEGFVWARHKQWFQ